MDDLNRQQQWYASLTEEQKQARLAKARMRPRGKRKPRTPEQKSKYAAQRKARETAMTPEEKRALLDRRALNRKPQTREQKLADSAYRKEFWKSLSEEERKRRIAKMKTYDSQYGPKRSKKAREGRQKRMAIGMCASSFSCDQPLAGNSKFCLKHWLVTIAAAEKRVGKCSWQLLLKIWNNQKGICPITGAKLIPSKNANLDHIIPIALKGGNGEDNLRFVHQVFNDMKDALLDSELKSFLIEYGQQLLDWAKKDS